MYEQYTFAGGGGRGADGRCELGAAVPSEAQPGTAVAAGGCVGAPLAHRRPGAAEPQDSRVSPCAGAPAVTGKALVHLLYIQYIQYMCVEYCILYCGCTVKTVVSPPALALLLSRVRPVSPCSTYSTRITYCVYCVYCTVCDACVYRYCVYCM